MTESFTCERCLGTFPKSRDDAEALAEYARLFPEHADHPKATVCEPCWREIVAWYQARARDPVGLAILMAEDQR